MKVTLKIFFVQRLSGVHQAYGPFCLPPPIHILLLFIIVAVVVECAVSHAVTSTMYSSPICTIACENVRSPFVKLKEVAPPTSPPPQKKKRKKSALLWSDVKVYY